MGSLRAELDGFLTRASVRVSIERDPRAGRNTVEAVLIREIPPIIPLIIGDVLHNARAALDMAVAQLALARIGYVPRHVRFPFHASREALEHASREDWLEWLGAAPARAILEEIRPFPGGNEPLCALHELDIRNRHLRLIPQVRIVELRDMEFEDHTRILWFRLTSLLDEFGHAQKPLLAASGPLRIVNTGQPVFAVLMPPGIPMAGLPLLATLAHFTQAVSAVIARLEAATRTSIR